MSKPTQDEPATAPAVVIKRSFDAPLELIWQMWTDPTHFCAWYGPDGASVLVTSMDLRVGGTRRLRMEVATPNGVMQMWFTGHYTEIVENRLLVYTESVCDPDGNITSADGHPRTTTVRVELDRTDGRTTMVLTHTGIPADSPGAAGWAMALAKLDTHLTAPTTR